jgi:hypothetical protein
MTDGPAKTNTLECPPVRLPRCSLSELLDWYIKNLCDAEILDPRGYRVLFTPERFPHLIKLVKKSGKPVSKPAKVVKQILNGELCEADFGGFDQERAFGLTWIRPIIERPTKIIAASGELFDKAGDTLLVKQFKKGGFKFKILVCRKQGPKLLVPVTCHPRDHDRFPKGHRHIWPL